MGQTAVIADSSFLSRLSIFLGERFPYIANTILVSGLILSISNLGAGASWETLGGGLFSFAAGMIFILELRLMDELKDYDKDLLAHPQRPLPRGLIKVSEVKSMMTYLYGFMWGMALMSWPLFNTTSALLYAVTVLWLGLMYKEFFLGTWLEDRPLLYAISHQVVIVPLILFICSVTDPSSVWMKESWSFALIILGTFFSYEVGRKLDPSSHKALKTYLHIYGMNKVIFIVTVLLAVTLFGAYSLGVLWWLSPGAALIFLTLIKVKTKPDKFKDAEGLIALNLIFNAWFLVIRGWFA